jgi:uncharacterized Zn-finger protein
MKKYVIKKPATAREIRKACGVTAADIRKGEEILRSIAPKRSRKKKAMTKQYHAFVLPGNGTLCCDCGLSASAWVHKHPIWQDLQDTKIPYCPYCVAPVDRWFELDGLLFEQDNRATTTMDCEHCGQPFHIELKVRRSFTTTKIEEPSHAKAP